MPPPESDELVTFVIEPSTVDTRYATRVLPVGVVAKTPVLFVRHYLQTIYIHLHSKYCLLVHTTFSSMAIKPISKELIYRYPTPKTIAMNIYI